MRVVITLSILAAVFAFSRAEYPELSEGSMAEVERVRKFTDEDARNKIKFWLYTSKNRVTGQPLNINDIPALRSSNFDASKPVRFLIHGFMNDKDSDFNVKVTEAYLKRGSFNVIRVDWGALAKNLGKYDNIAESIHHISLLVANMAKFLNKQGAPFKKMYAIGHSLGAHICGMAGQNLGRSKFHVIFGLDPAGPKFENINENDRLDAGDADYVETIQTDIVPYTAANAEEVVRTKANKITTFGYMGTVGRASFFPNFGESQPGCSGFGVLPGCSHSRSYEYFAESLDNKYTFYGQRCGSYQDILNQKCSGSSGETIIMGGEPAHTNNTGIFYVPVGSKFPYSENVKNHTATLYRRLFGR